MIFWIDMQGVNNFVIWKYETPLGKHLPSNIRVWSRRKYILKKLSFNNFLNYKMSKIMNFIYAAWESISTFSSNFLLSHLIDLSWNSFDTWKWKIFHPYPLLIYKFLFSLLRHSKNPAKLLLPSLFLLER